MKKIIIGTLAALMIFSSLQGSFSNNEMSNSVVEASTVNKAIKTNKTVLLKKGYTVWNDLGCKKSKNKSDNLLGNPYTVKYYYNQGKGYVYYSLYASNGNWVGYINTKGAKEVKKTTSAVNISVNTKGQNLWNNLAYKKALGNTSKYYNENENLVAKVAYTTDPGWTYYSLYNHKGEWQGYINSKFATPLTAKNYDRNVKTIKKETLFNDLFWKKRGTTDSDVSYSAKYVYHEGNGKDYLSLYKSNTWVGYIDKNSVKGDSFGSAINTNKTVILNKGYKIWNDLNFNKEKNQSDNLLGNIYTVKYYRNHDDGNVYYSLYNSDGSWAGYVDSKGAKVITKKTMSQMISINNRNQNLWNNLAYQKVKNLSSKYYDGNQQLTAKVAYTTSPGYTYYSLYDDKGVWQGYINSKFTSNVTAKTYNKSIQITYSAPFWNNFFWNSKRSTPKVGAKYTTKYSYTMGNGKTYLSVYNGNTWMGYINKTSTKEIQESGTEKAIKVALSKVGKPYQLGAAGPNAFDCSGLTQFSYKGIHKLDRTTTQQENDGKQVSVNSLKRGDLVFWGSHGSTYHVGLYLGNNEYVHAPKPGDKVKVEKIISAFKPSFGVRL